MNNVNVHEIDNKLWELHKACNVYKNTDCLADWVLFALSRYLLSNRATRQFEIAFLNFPAENFEMLIKKCLNGDRSDDGIIKTCKRVFDVERTRDT